MFYSSVLLRVGRKIVTFKTPTSDCYTTVHGEMMISESPKQSITRIVKHNTGLDIDMYKFNLWSIERQDDSKFWMFIVDISEDDVSRIQTVSQYKLSLLVDPAECPHPQSWVLNTYIDNSPTTKK